MKERYLSGVVSAMVTPLDKQGEKVDHGAIKTLVDFLLEKGITVLFPLGSTGEGILFSVEERKAIAESVIGHVSGRVPVVVHIGSHRLDEVIHLARHAASSGADGIAVVPPFYYSLDELALGEFFSSVASAVPNTSVYLYNIPSNAKNHITPNLFTQLASKHENIIGIKESSQDFAAFYQFIQTAKENHVKLMGNDAQFLPALVMGANGCVSAGSTAIPEPFVEVYRAFQAGDMEEAKKWQKVCAQVKQLLVKPYPVSPNKKVLSLRNVIHSGLRKPLRDMTTEEREELYRGLKRLGFV